MSYAATVIGAGRGGKLSLAALFASHRYRLAAVADPDEDARLGLARDFSGVEIYPSHIELFAGCASDVVCVSAPTPMHYDITLEALEQQPRGLLVEKPLAISSAQARDLLGRIVRAGIPLVVPHGMFALAVPRQVLRLVHDGAVGELDSIEVQNSVDLLNAGIHWISYALALLEGDPVVSVLAACDTEERVINDGAQVESAGMTCFRTQRGVSLMLQSGVHTTIRSVKLPAMTHKGALFRLSGSAGMLEFHAWGDRYWLLNGEHPGGAVVHVEAAEESPHQWFLEELARQIDSQQFDYEIAERSVEALALIEAAYLSAQTCTRRRLPDEDVTAPLNTAWRLGQAHTSSE